MKKDLSKEEFTFDDILLLPGNPTIELAEEKIIDISSSLTKKIKLKVPLVSSNMSNVTESEMAIELAIVGGIGIIHQFMEKERQLEEVRKVKNQNLLVGAAVFSFGNEVISQIKALKKIGCDVVLIDSANAHNNRVIKLVKDIKKEIDCELIVGNVVTSEATRDLIRVGVDGIRVGIGPGSHCTTRVITGFGRPQLSAIMECAQVAKKYKVPIMADGGVKSPGDVVKALALGADTVMLGGMLTGTDKSPGKVFKRKGKFYKESWGNCTDKAYRWTFPKGKIRQITKSAIRRIIPKRNLRVEEDIDFVEEGVSALIEYKGEVRQILNQIKGGVRRGLWYGGAKNINNLQKKVKVIHITPSSLQEAQASI